MGIRKRLPSLKTLEGIQHNLERVFREARNGDMEVVDASKFAYILKILHDMSSAREFERRIEQLEKSYEQQAIDQKTRRSGGQTGAFKAI
jgi:chemotaxis protein histidine kinase CheA